MAEAKGDKGAAKPAKDAFAQGRPASRSSKAVPRPRRSAAAQPERNRTPPAR